MTIGGLHNPPTDFFLPTKPTSQAFWGSPTMQLGTSTYTVQDQSLLAVPIPVFYTTTYDQIAFEVTTAAGAGGTPKARLAIYADNGAFYPGNLIHDIGTALEDDLTAVAAARQITFSTAQTLGKGWYWLAFVANFGGTAPVVRAGGVSISQHHVLGISSATIGTGTHYTGYRGNITWASGTAMPNPYTAGQTIFAGILPFLMLRSQ